MAATSFSFINGTPIIVRDDRRVLSIASHLTLCRIKTADASACSANPSFGAGCCAWLTSAKLHESPTVVVRRTYQHEVVLLRQGQGCAKRLTDLCSPQPC